ncbi:alkaline phosphatase [Brevifollis gellanilyticus]|uniref:Alkaline phosphatase n=1 Tax=Brevifollis gellanilyticus TaxID=748831 RepID=A0A512MDN9_9BACT|nr:alkaline phosphatase [Brevifollis gellanilyticus]GEP44856.1 alkaline phosphatase [Brevifollis gellanilyticus]
MKPSLLLAISMAAASLAGSASAAPAVTRLNPPSALFTSADPTPPYISRFLPDQRFDLQATIQADAGQTITGAVFKVNNVVVPGTVTVTNIGSDKFSVALRAYSTPSAGVKTLTVEATQSGGTTASAQGNFEIVALSRTRLNGVRKAKNIIYLIGDGMGIAHRTAARIVAKGVSQGKAIEPLAMDRMPYTALLMTSSLNSIVTDSAPGAACYSTGNKSNNNQEGVFPDDTTATLSDNKWDNPRVEHMGTYLARKQGKALGIVTTADVEDATPASFGVHAQDRGAGTGICDMFLDEAAVKSNLRVLMGGGRKWFLPSTTGGSGRVNSTTASGADYVLPADIVAGWNVAAGAVDPNRDLIADFQTAGFAYTPDATSLAAIPANTTKLLGLFNNGNMDVSMDKIAERRGGASVGTVATFPDQPMLDEMTDKALQVLSKNAQGFVLMIEGASIDKQAHNMDTERWILEAIEFDRAIAKCLAFAQTNPDTLVIVTADHECAGINIIGSSIVTNAELVTRSTALGNDATQGVINGATGASTDGQTKLRTGVVGTYEAASFPQYQINADGYPQTLDVNYKMLIGYAGSGDRYEDWLTNATPNVSGAARDTAGDFFIPGQASGAGASTAVHTASDIPLSAAGRGASLFHGVMENTDVFFHVMQAALVGAQ